MVKEKKAKISVEHLYCDKCGTEMEWTGIWYTTDPPQCLHRCPKCGFEFTTRNAYPRTIYKEV